MQWNFLNASITISNPPKKQERLPPSWFGIFRREPAQIIVVNALCAKLFRVCIN